MYSFYVGAALTFLWPLVPAAPQQQGAIQPSAQWIGPDPTHITYDRVLATTNGIAETTTAPIDVSVQPASTTAADGSYEEAILLAPNVIAELTDAAQQACGGKRKKRSLSACVLSDTALQDTATELITVGMAPEKAEVYGAAALGMIAANALNLWANVGLIPNAVKINLGTPTQTLGPSTTTSSTLASSTFPSSSSPGSTIGSTTTMPPKDTSRSTTSTTSTSTIDTSSCWQYTGSDPKFVGFDSDDEQDSTNAGDPPGSKISARQGLHSLEKRDRHMLDKLGSCALNTHIRRAPPYWHKHELMANVPSQQWWFVPSQEARNYQSCPVAEIVQKGKREPNDPSTTYDNFPVPYNTESQSEGINVEHVYELSILQDFFRDQFQPGDTRCDAFNKIFLQPDGRLTDRSLFDNSDPPQLKAGEELPLSATPAQFMDSRLQSLWNELPNKFNKAFIGMSKALNDVKGCMFNINCRDLQNVKPGTQDVAVNANLNLWNDIGMVMQLMRDPVVQAQHQKVHQEIYKAFVSFEDIQACDPSSGLTTPWGEVYNDWYRSFLKDNQQGAANHVKSLSQAVAKPRVTGKREKTAFGKAVDALSLSYGSSAIVSGSLSFEIDKLLSIPARTTLGIKRRNGLCSTTTTIDPPVTGLPTLPSSPVCSTRQDKGNGVCPQIIIPNPSTTPCPPLTTSGQYCADLTTSAISSAPTATICPDPNPKKNLAHNRCDQKCMGAGWGNCDASVKDQYNRYTCYCNDGPCGGQQCGDPVKIDGLTGKGTKCPDQNNPALWFPDDQACDIACPNGNYGAGDSCFAKTTIYHTMKTTPIIGPKYGTPTKTVAVAVSTASDKNGLVHWDAGAIPLCKCDDDPCKGFGCYDRLHEL